MPKLKDIKIDEISFVDVPANRRRFLLVKREDAHEEEGGKENSGGNTIMDKLIQLYKALTGQEITSEEIEKDDKLQQALTALESWDEDLPTEIIDAFKTMNETVQKKAEADTEEPVVDDILSDYISLLEKVQKAGAKLSKDTITKLKDIASKINALLPEGERFMKVAPNQEERILDALKDLSDRMGKLEKGDGEDDEGDETDVAKTLKAIDERLKVVEKNKGVRKGADNDGNDGNDEDGGSGDEDPWPSINIE